MATVPATPPNNAHHGRTSTFYLGMIYNKRLTNFTTQLAVLKQRTLIVDTIIRAIFAALISVVLLSACISHPDEPDITGMWMREQEVLPESTIVTSPNEMGQNIFPLVRLSG